MNDERWALILGCSAGAGAAIGRSLADKPGLNVFGIHRGNHMEGAEEVGRAVEAAGRRARFLLGDAGKQVNIEEQADAVLEACGPRSIHILVHSIANASVGHLAKGERWLHPKQINKTFESMAHSFIYWTQELLRRDLFAPDARILALDNAINESILGNLAAVAAAKMALESYVRYLAMDLADRGIRVNALKFGTVESAALQHIFPADVWEGVREVHDRMFPGGRMCTMDEVGAFVSVLASAEGHFFNSAVIDMTGGQMHGVYQLLMDVVAETSRAAAQRG